MYLIIDTLSQFCKMDQSKDLSSGYVPNLYACNKQGLNKLFVYCHVDVAWWLSVWPHHAHHILCL